MSWPSASSEELRSGPEMDASTSSMAEAIILGQRVLVVGCARDLGLALWEISAELLVAASRLDLLCAWHIPTYRSIDLHEAPSRSHLGRGYSIWWC